MASSERGKHLLLVGAAWNRTAQGFWYEVAKDIGLKLTVADKPGHWTEKVVGSLVHSFLPLDLEMPSKSLTDKLVKIVTSSEINFSAVMTLKDAHLVAVAEAAEKLGMATAGSEVYRNIRDKEKVRILIDSPVLKFRIKGTQDLSEAAKTVGFPAVLKPVEGADSLAVRLVNSIHELQDVYRLLKSKLPNIKSIIGEISDFILEQYIEGSEHNVDLIVQNGEILFAAVSDDLSGNEPWFQESQLSHPSKLGTKDQQALIKYAVNVCSKLNMTNGVVHVEVKLSSGIIRLLEVNPRMGCSYVAHGVKAVWGVELIKHVYEIAMGLPVSQLPNHGSLDILKNPPTTFAVAKYVNAPFTGYVQTDDFLNSLYGNDKVSLVLPLVRKGQKVQGPEDDVPDILAFFMVTGTDSIEATEEEAEKAVGSINISEVLLKQQLTVDQAKQI